MTEERLTAEQWLTRLTKAEMAVASAEEAYSKACRGESLMSPDLLATMHHFQRRYEIALVCAKIAAGESQAAEDDAKRRADVERWLDVERESFTP